jgi:hypothetical protein
MTIQVDDGQRYSALVLHRSGHEMTLAGEDGRSYRLGWRPEDLTFSDFRLSEGSQREMWVTISAQST